jgi:hypothetical protein
MGLGRVELPTYGLGNRRSIHLSYSPSEAILSDLSDKVADESGRLAGSARRANENCRPPSDNP